MTETRWRCRKCKAYVPDERVIDLPGLDRDTRLRLMLRGVPVDLAGATDNQPCRVHDVTIGHAAGGGRIGYYETSIKCGPLERYEVQEQELFVEWLEKVAHA